MKINENRLRKIIGESIRKILKEEEENNAVNNKIIDLISFLHNAQLPVREIHWNTRQNALHLTTDETIKDLLEWEDTLAEAFISNKSINLKINDTKPSTSENFHSILNELIDLANDVKSSIGENENSICAVIDDIMEGSNKHLYRAQFK